MKNLQKAYKKPGPSDYSAKQRKEKNEAWKYVFIVDKSLAITSWNVSMEKLSHIPAKNIIGNKVDRVFPLLHDEILLVFGGGKEKKIKQFRNNCFMGTNLCADIRIVPEKKKKEQVVSVSVFFDNIKGECPLNKELVTSEKMVAIGKIASSLAHGIRNPLNAIKGAVVYLREKYGHESTLLEFSTIINEEIDKLDDFISNFLSTAKEKTHFHPVNLNDILKAILVMIQPRAEVQDIKISHNLSVLPLITGDSFQIEQALFNLINNALEAMPDGGAIDIKTSLKWEKDIDYVVIEISDTGKGIPDKKLRKLGELSSGAEDHDKGFGVFLSREVIKAHNGRLLYESVRNRGTIFKVFLPVEKSERSV
jgi:two-component system nitrogen regulation sensor histidine kinase GlnL